MRIASPPLNELNGSSLGKLTGCHSITAEAEGSPSSRFKLTLTDASRLHDFIAPTEIALNASPSAIWSKSPISGAASDSVTISQVDSGGPASAQLAETPRINFCRSTPLFMVKEIGLPY